MSSPLAEAFLLVTLNNCYETPSYIIQILRGIVRWIFVCDEGA